MKNSLYEIFDNKHLAFLPGRFPINDMGTCFMVYHPYKAFILFFILRLFFFPDFLKTATTDVEKDEYVSRELIMRIQE